MMANKAGNWGAGPDGKKPQKKKGYLLYSRLHGRLNALDFLLLFVPCLYYQL
jgi:hypothetical protein